MSEHSRRLKIIRFPATASLIGGILWMSIMINSTLMPLYMQNAGLSEGTIGFILGMTSVGSLASRLLLGWAIDRFDPRRFIFWSALAIAGVSLTISLTQNPFVFTLCRLIQGFANGIFVPAILVYATGSISSDMRESMIGINETIAALAISPSPMIAVWAKDSFSIWHGFWIACGVGLLATLITLILPVLQRAETDVPVIPASKPHLLSVKALVPGCHSGWLFPGRERVYQHAPDPGGDLPGCQ